MKIYLYDGTIDGFLSAVYDLYNEKEEFALADETFHKKTLLYEERVLEKSEEKAAKVYAKLKGALRWRSFHNIIYCLCVKEEYIGRLLVEYIKLGMRHKEVLDFNLTESVIKKVNNISGRVGFEVHRFLGLLRFEELTDGILYAPFEPDNNISHLLIPHFSKRLSGQKFIIHDTKRNISIMYDGAEIIINPEIELIYSKQWKREDDYSELWKRYYKAINIEERKNLKQQKGYMPVRYWKYLTEKK